RKWTQRHAKAAVGAGFGRRGFRAIGGGLVAGAAGKNSPPISAIRDGRRTGWVNHVAARITAVPIATPLPDISRHVVKHPGVGFFLCDRSGTSLVTRDVEAAAGVTLEAIAVIPRDVIQHRRASAMKNQRSGEGGCRRAGAAGVFPLSFRGQIEFVSGG